MEHPPPPSSQPPAAPPPPQPPSSQQPAPAPPQPPPSPPSSRRRRWAPRLALAAEAVVLVATLGALGLWCSVPATAPLATRNPTSTAFIDLRRTEAEAAGKPFRLRWQWRSLAAISRYLRASVIYAEDYNFYHHDGVDWQAIEHALSTDLHRGALSIGGSTITQQLAKNLYLSPRRSLFRKAREVLIAFALEDELSKQRILELYLNVVEWGDGVFGAEAAARTWFHHSAQSLSPAEAVRLATALPNPFTRAPSVRDPELTRKHVRLIRLLRMQGLVDAAQERTALDEVGAPGERVLPDRASEAEAVLRDVEREAPPRADQPPASSAPPPGDRPDDIPGPPTTPAPEPPAPHSSEPPEAHGSEPPASTSPESPALRGSEPSAPPAPELPAPAVPEPPAAPGPEPPGAASPASPASPAAPGSPPATSP